MNARIRTTASLLAMSAIALSGYAAAQSIDAAVASSNRTDANIERDGSRKPADMLAFIGLASGDVVLDYGAGGGSWAELFSGVVGSDGKVYAHQNAGQRYDENEAGWKAQFEPFGNIELLPVTRGDALPLDDGSVDTVMVSYLYHHMHYAEGSGESFPESSVALFGEFSRVLKPGGTVIVIEHAAADGTSRTESGGWHRTPPETAKADITGVGFEFADEAPELYYNAEDDLRNVWFETGLSGKTTTFVHKYRKPD
jgi:predicted methyltransferase